MLFCLAWREQWLGLTSKRVPALSQLFPLHSFSYCSLSQLRVWALNHLCTTQLYHCISSEWCSVTHGLTNGCNSLLQNDSLLFSSLPSAVSSIKAIIMSHPGWFCFSVMVILCEERFRALAWLLRSPEQDSLILWTVLKALYPCNSHHHSLRQLCVHSTSGLFAQQGEASSPCSCKLTAFIHTLKELKAGFSAKALGLYQTLITAAVLLVIGTGQRTNSCVPE